MKVFLWEYASSASHLGAVRGHIAQLSLVCGILLMNILLKINVLNQCSLKVDTDMYLK